MFTTYSASAGSGKTTNLVADYLSLCFRFDSKHVGQSRSVHQLDLYQKLLAITFTNNTSGEMKDRIVRTLQTFAFEEKERFNGSEKAIFSMVVTKLFGPEPALEADVISQFIKIESKELLRRIIFDYARFAVSTIDRFSQRIIRSSALSLNLNLNYSVQIDMDEFYLQAIDQLLNELSAETDLARRIIFLLDNSMEDSGKVDVDGELKSALEILYKNAEKNLEYLDILSRSDREEMKRKTSELRKNIKDYPTVLKEKLAPIVGEGNMWIRKLALGFKRSSLSHWFDDVLADPITNYIPDIKGFYGANDQLLSKTKIKPDEQERIDECVPHILDCFQRVINEQNVWRKKYLDSVIRSKNADKLLMLKDLKLKMEEIKIQNNLFILSESNTLIYETIRDRGFETLFDRVKFENFFIDEFQDTSKMQWDNLKPIIINNALSQSDRQVSLFGDVKQAIYRFRNGDSELFYKLLAYDRFKEDPDLRMVDEAHYHQKPLSTNYRSLKSVIEFNNEFFDFYSKEKNLEKYYAEGLKQQVHNQDSGLVQVFLFKGKDAKKYARANRPMDADLIERWTMDASIKVQDMEVLCAVQDARMRGYKDGEIAVLCRKNDVCKHLSNIMLRLGWNVVSEKSLNLATSEEVNLLIYTLQYLLHPTDTVAKSSILYYISRLRNDDGLFTRYTPMITSGDALDKILEQEFGGPIPRNKWLSEPLFLLMKDMMVYYGLEQLQSPFLVDFDSLVLSYLQSNNGEPAKFLMWWWQQVALGKLPSLTLPSGQDAIQLMTIHKSKGLEYPVVIMPYTKPKEELAPVWDKVDDETVAYVELDKKNSLGSSYEDRFKEESLSAEMDNLNVLYVSQTRARDLLYIIAQQIPTNPNSYGSLLYKFVNQNAVLSFEKDEEDERVFYLGDRNWSKKEKKNDEDKQQSVFPAMVKSDFALAQVNMFYEPEIPEDDPRAEGTFVHDFLAGMAGFPQTMEDFERYIEDVDEDRKPRLREAFSRILEDAALRPCFAEGVRVLNEVNILGEDGKEHRPDRVVFLEDKVVVIDYKTGSPHPQYQKQIDEYCALLRNMGYENVEGKLLFV